MTFPFRVPLRKALAVSALTALVTLPSMSWAQDEAPTLEGTQPDSLTDIEEMGTFRLRYSTVLRSGHFSDPGSRLNYSGRTGDDFGIYGTAFGLGSFGVVFEAAREIFFPSIEGDDLRSITLLRGKLGLAARAMIGPVRIETTVAYGVSQLPSVPETLDPRFLLAVRRSIHLGGRAVVPLPHKLLAEARVELPLALWAIDGRGRRLETSGWLAGAMFGRQLWETPRYRTQLFVEWQLARDLADTATGRSQAQTVNRFGLTAGISWKDT